jgi:hypothetical protein
VLGWWVGDVLGKYVAWGAGLLIALFGTTFHHLTVEDQGDVVAIRFGPVSLFRRRVNYADVEEVEVGRTRFLDGWDIHYSIQGGWVWNLWG